MKKNVLALFLFLFVLGVNAQNLDDVFDDGGLSEVQGFFRTNLSKFIEGDINIGYNKYFTDKNISVGLAVGYKVFNGYNMAFGGNAADADGGYFFEFNYYTYDYLFEGFYLGGVFRYNKYKTSTSDCNGIDLGVIYGYRYYFADRFSVAADIGVSFSLMDYVGISIPFNIYVGMDF